MNEQPKQPLVMTYNELRKTLVPFCKGKKPLLDMINDIWNSATPQPQLIQGRIVKMIFPGHFEKFINLLIQENG